MGAIKNHYFDEIEQRMRVYDIIELQKMTPADLHDLADSMGIDAELKSRALKIAAILYKQSGNNNDQL